MAISATGQLAWIEFQSRDVGPAQLPRYIRRLGKAKMRLDLPKTTTEVAHLDAVWARHSGNLLGDDTDKQHRLMQHLVMLQVAQVGVSMIAMALWVLKPDSLDGASPANRRGAFLATLIVFFIAEIGDKTQIATVALAAGYSSLTAVVGGTTYGMLLANAPVVFLGKAFATRLPLMAIHYGASCLFAVLGAVFIIRALMH